ncbi:hypothetical protein ABEB36_008406 [Hypothenemus hampei]|uniref:Uncharacterized protein n=1 Tax=Hypothenemus hampei TaxID=57062 RepID=A0ABD1ELQ2_HYPHA
MSQAAPQIEAAKLMRGLAEAEHDVTVVNPFPLKNPPIRFKDVILDGLAKGYEDKFTIILRCGRECIASFFKSTFQLLPSNGRSSKHDLGWRIFVDPPKKKIPNNLQHFMDIGTEGVIYFSLGSNLFMCGILPDRKRIIISALGKLPQKVLWKSDLAG